MSVLLISRYTINFKRNDKVPLLTGNTAIVNSNGALRINLINSSSPNTFISARFLEASRAVPSHRWSAQVSSAATPRPAPCLAGTSCCPVIYSGSHAGTSAERRSVRGPCPFICVTMYYLCKQNETCRLDPDNGVFSL